ncbi:MAG: tetratricopeptide repeat protein [Sediminibacterium sp.]
MKDLNSSKPKLLALALLLFSIFLLSYSNHFNNTFHFDDSHTIEDNPYIKNINNCAKFFYTPQMFSTLPSHWGLRPIVSVSLAVDYWLAGELNPFYFHLSTFIWFTLICVLLFFVYQKILNQAIDNEWTKYCALLIAAWYAMHTANAETINYIISRSDVLSTFFILLSFGIFILAPKKRKYFLYIIPAVIGVFTKETVLTLVIILFFYINLFEKNISIAGHFKKTNFNAIFKTILSLLPLFFCVAAVQYYTLSQIKSTNDISNPLGYYILTQSFVWVRYTIAFFIPANLSADSDWGVISNIFDERIIVGLIFISLLVYTIFKTSLKKETKPISFGLIWFSVSLLPTSIAPFAEVTNDHRMFFAFIGLALATGNYVLLLVQKIKSNSANQLSLNRLLLFGVFAVICLNANGVYQRNKVWKTEESLWYDVTVKSPANGRGLMNYGLTQMAKGNYDGANTYFQKALFYNPYYDALYINIAILKAATNQNQEAEDNFKKAIEYNKRSSHLPFYYYARYLKNNQRYTEAEQMALKSNAVNPYSIEPLDMLAAIYSETQQWDKLVETANKILQIQPNNLKGKNYLLNGTNKKPLESKSIVKPVTSADYINQSLLFYNTKEFQKCIDACNSALKIDSNNADAYNNMGAAYNQLAEWQKAIEACSKALQLNPSHRLAKGNLNWAKSELNKKTQ